MSEPVGQIICPLRIMCIVSTPASIRRAAQNDLNPIMGLTRRLMARWSCSTMLFRYLDWRSSMASPLSSSNPFTAAVFGGIGNLGGAVVGGILLGLIESIGSGYIGELTGGVLGSHYTDIFAFIVLIIVLTLRPSGLMGERVADRA